MKTREVNTNTTEFKSKLEDLMPAEELIFPALKFKNIVTILESEADNMKKSKPNTRDFIYNVLLKALMGLMLLVLYALLKWMGVL